MGLLRSEVMKRGTLVVPQHRAHRLVDVLGRRGNVQFTDMNEATLRRQYKKYIQRIDEMERKLRFLFELINDLTDVEIHTASADEFLEYDHFYQLEKVEATLNTLHSQFIRFRDNNQSLLDQKNEALEEKYVVQMAIKYFKMGRYGNMSRLAESSDVKYNIRDSFENSARQALLSEEGQVEPAASHLAPYAPTPVFSNIAGVISITDQKAFERVLFHSTRGNSYVLFDEITTDSKTQEPLSAFVVYFQGAFHGTIAEKIRNICKSFSCRLYEWIVDLEEGENRLKEITDRLFDKQRAVEAYEQYFKNEIAVLLQVANPSCGSLLEDWRLFSLKEKAIYSVLDMFEGTDITMRINCWFPAKRENELKWILSEESQTEHASAFLLADEFVTDEAPPTYNRTTEFTDVFQVLVDTYGVPRYREANPALFTIVTFPFLFGIMFGDMGHGLCLLLLGIYLLFSHKDWEKKGEFGYALSWSRYLILLLGVSSTYCGFLYNEFFSLGIGFFRSRWIPNGITNATSQWKASNNFPYPFGMDPKWKGAVNELPYVNSFKMKFAVIVAYVQMTSGILLNGYNSIQFFQPLDFFFGFLPQLVLFTCFTGYMNFLIIYKWVTPIGAYAKPSLIGMMVKLCLNRNLEASEIMFNGQQRVHLIILCSMGASIFCLLIPKPLILLLKRKVDNWRYKRLPTSNQWDGNLLIEPSEQEDDLAEVALHQTIEALEFILGIISNTASYLRLWALSLAHQQLSIIFLEYTVVLAINRNSLWVMIILLFFTVSAFALITAGALLGMDSIECFLHAVRLQWVEFQNKFFKADGYKFMPFDLKAILKTPPA